MSPLFALGILGFIVILLASVAIHELGHLITAKRYGMKASEYFVGFGPRIWSFRRGETEYGLKAIPAGGYVKIIGMTDLEPVAEEDQPRAFYRQPAPQRLVVLAAGSVTHFILGLLIFWMVFVLIGVTKTSTTIAEVAPCVPVQSGQQCATGDPASPAAAAGLRAGDRIVAVDGTPIESWRQSTEVIRAAGNQSVQIVVERDGREQTVVADLVTRERRDLDDPEKTVTVGVLGVSPKPVVDRMNPIAGVGESARAFWITVKATGQVLVAIPSKLPELWSATFDGGKRDVEGLVGPVGIARISGEVLSAGEEPLAGRVGSFLAMMASLNVFIGIFNLLPLLPLDGGHIAVLLFEKTRSRVYRLFGRPDPGRVDLTRLLPAAYFFLVLLVGLTVLLLVADIANPLRLTG